MPLFEWNSRYSVGIERFDQEHERLFDLMNQLHDATRAGRERSLLENIFQELIEYTDEHFSAEEAAMGVHRYPDAAAHKLQHDQLRKRTTEFLARHRSGTSKLGIDMVNFLLRWWTDHILGSDKQYAAFFDPAKSNTQMIAAKKDVVIEIEAQ